MIQKNIKQQLYKQCQAYVKQRLQTIETSIASNKKGLQSETKSSAGDKHETGRAMLQLEMEKAGQQLNVVQQMQIVLEKIGFSTSAKKAHLGSIIETAEKTYFLAISMGKVQIATKEYFIISSHSPIGKLLLGKQEGESFIWNNKTIVLRKII